MHTAQDLLKVFLSIIIKSPVIIGTRYAKIYDTPPRNINATDNAVVTEQIAICFALFIIITLLIILLIAKYVNTMNKELIINSILSKVFTFYNFEYIIYVCY